MKEHQIHGISKNLERYIEDPFNRAEPPLEIEHDEILFPPGYLRSMKIIRNPDFYYIVIDLFPDEVLKQNPTQSYRFGMRIPRDDMVLDRIRLLLKNMD